MKKYKVILNLMVDPTRGERTEPLEYEIEAIDQREAYKKAEQLWDNEESKIRTRSLFNYSVQEIS